MKAPVVRRVAAAADALRMTAVQTIAGSIIPFCISGSNVSIFPLSPISGCAVVWGCAGTGEDGIGVLAGWADLR